MVFEARIGTVKDFLVIFSGVFTGFVFVILISVITGEETRYSIPALFIIALISAVTPTGAVALLRAKFKYFITLSETSLSIKVSRFAANSIFYENIISLNTSKRGIILLTYRIKSKRKYTYHFTTENQDEFLSRLQTYINQHNGELT